MSEMKHAVVLGASGYTGAEAVRLILAHPRLELVALTGHSKAGQPYADVYPHFSGLGLPDLVKADAVDWTDVNVVFACLPHGASQDAIAGLVDKVETIIDLSADFRLSNAEVYAQTYGRPHDHAQLLEQRVYGLTEYAKDQLLGAKLVACPGCYPTCSLLALLPAIKGSHIDPGSIIIDAKSGVTGAGRKTSDGLLYSQLTDGAHAYAVGTHRHTPEIEQGLHALGGAETHVTFTPHLLPMNRGMIATCYVDLNAGVSVEALREAYVNHYKDDVFVHIEASGVVPQTRHIKGSNMCRIAILADRVPGRAVIVSVIDNLTKGSSGQAVQNYNLTQGWDEALGLPTVALFP